MSRAADVDVRPSGKQIWNLKSAYEICSDNVIISFYVDYAVIWCVFKFRCFQPKRPLISSSGAAFTHGSQRTFRLNGGNDLVSSRMWMSGLVDTWMTPQEQNGGMLCLCLLFIFLRLRNPSLKLHWIWLQLFTPETPEVPPPPPPGPCSTRTHIVGLGLSLGDLVLVQGEAGGDPAEPHVPQHVLVICHDASAPSGT